MPRSRLRKVSRQRARAATSTLLLLLQACDALRRSRSDEPRHAHAASGPRNATGGYGVLMAYRRFGPSRLIWPLSTSLSMAFVMSAAMPSRVRCHPNRRGTWRVSSSCSIVRASCAKWRAAWAISFSGTWSAARSVSGRPGTGIRKCRSFWPLRWRNPPRSASTSPACVRPSRACGSRSRSSPECLRSAPPPIPSGAARS